jgi:hypothetical protein
MGRKAAEIEPEKLWELFQQKVQGLKDNPDCDSEEGYISPYDFQNIDKIGEDLKKVQFDFENCEYEHQNEWGKWEGMLGYRKEYPLSYIGAMAGGDWEYPVYFIIYLDQDGKTFRAYIPKDGNQWNHDTKAAFGSASELGFGENADPDFVKKWVKKNRPDIVASCVDFDEEFDGEGDACEIMFNKDAIRRDIKNRIEVVSKKK